MSGVTLDRSLARVGIVSLGGTWNMVSNDKTGEFEPQVLSRGFDLAKVFPELSAICRPEVHELAAIDSTNIVPEVWGKTAAFLEGNREKYDGFVVLQGTDTLAYSAAGLAFALQGFCKPVMLTGAQLPRGVPGSDARANVVNACRLAAMRKTGPVSRDHIPALAEVAVVFGTRIIRATRCRKYSEFDIEAFDTVNTPLLGRIGLKIRLSSSMVLRQKVTTSPNFKAAAKFAPGIVTMHLYPGMTSDVLDRVGQNAAGVVLAAFGAGNVPSIPDDPHSLVPAIQSFTGRQIPVVVTTQCVVGRAEHNAYQAGGAAARAGAIIANDLTPECAAVKLSWLLANEDRWPAQAKRALRGGPGRMGAIRTAMLTDLVGEVTSNRELKGLFGS